MPNIPILGNARAQATTRTIDRSGTLALEQRGISDFSNFLDKTLESGAQFIDTKIYESESARAQGEIINFIAESTDPEEKNKFYAKNKTLAGFHIEQGKRNRDKIQQALSKVNHPRARAELEKRLTFQAEKAVLSDLNEENRVTRQLVLEKEESKNQLLEAEISAFTTPESRQEHDLAVTNRLAEITKSANSGTIGRQETIALRNEVINHSAKLRAETLVENGYPNQAIAFAKDAPYSNSKERETTLRGIYSKINDGAQKAFKAINLSNRTRIAEAKRVSLQLDSEAQEINSSDASPSEKVQALAALNDKYKKVITTSRQTKIVDNITREEAGGLIATTLADIETIPLDETDTAKFNGARDSLKLITSNPNLPANVRLKALSGLKRINEKQKVHDAAVLAGAWDPLRKGGDTSKAVHTQIISQITDLPEYSKLPTEGKVEIYNLFKRGRAMFTIRISASNPNITNNPISMTGAKALRLEKRDPKKFKELIVGKIKEKPRKGLIFSSDVSDKEAERLYENFMEDYLDYKDNVENFESKSRDIIERYKDIR